MRRAILGVTAALTLAGCGPDAGPPPVLTLAGRTCTTTPDLGNALVIPSQNSEAKIALDANAACLETPGGKATYAAFRLPATNEPTLVDIHSEVRGTTIFSPRIVMLDATGKQLREIARDNFVYRGRALHLALRQQPGEQFLVAIADTATVGQSDTRLKSDVHSTPIFGGGFVNTGTETQQHNIFSHSGNLIVSVRPVPKS
jgi:hypothetical protein